MAKVKVNANESAFKKLTDNHGDNIKMTGAYVIDDLLLVSEEFIVLYFGIHKRSINVWQNKGLTKHPKSIPRLNLFDLKYVIGWHLKNVKNKVNNEMQNAELETDINKISAEEADRRKKIEEVKKIKMLNAELDKQLIRAEDTDRAMAEQAVLHRSQYSDDLDQLPASLENKSKEDIHNFLENHYERRIKNAHMFVSKVFDIPSYFYTKINEIIDAK